MKKVLVPLAQGCEELEAVTIIDLLVRAGMDVVTASLDDERLIRASRGVQLIAQTTLSTVEADVFDLIVLPGGLPGADYLAQDSRLISMLKDVAERGGWVAAVCAAPKVLAFSGLLEGKKATSYPGVLEDMSVERMTIVNAAVVVDGRVVTSRGPGTVMDFTLTLIEEMEGAEVRKTVEAGLVRD